jgi:hypothetical protein
MLLRGMNDPILWVAMGLGVVIAAGLLVRCG